MAIGITSQGSPKAGSSPICFELKSMMCVFWVLKPRQPSRQIELTIRQVSRHASPLLEKP